MKILQILAISIVGLSFAQVLRPYRPEMALLTAIVTGILALMYMFTDIRGLVDDLVSLADRYGINTELMGVLLKIVGVAYLAQIGARICADAGESAIAAKVETCGRILILSASMPQLLAVLSTAAELLGAFSP